MTRVFIRPPDIVYQRTYILPAILSSFFLLFFFFRRLISELAEPTSTKIGHMAGSKCNLKNHVRNLGYPSPTNRGPVNQLFGWLRNLTTCISSRLATFGWVRFPRATC